MKGRGLFVCGAVAAGLLAAACGRQGSSPQQSGAAPAAALEVEVVKVKSQKLDTTIALPAELLPYEAVDIYAKETGFIRAIQVDRGSKVKRGDLIAELDAPELVAQRAQANASYQSVESQLAAAQAKLAADEATYEHMNAAAKVAGVVAANDLEITQKTVQSDQANVAGLQKTAEAAQESVRAVAQMESYLTITAPFDGQVTARNVHPGTLVGPAGGAGAMTPIVRVETLTRHRLVVPVPENDDAGVSNGAMVSFTVPSFPGRTFRAPIARISHDVDTKTRTMPVELDVMDPNGELVPGTFCEVEWPVRRGYATLFAPVSAVAGDLERTFVIRVTGNRTEWVDVKTGVRTGDWIEVFGALQQGDQIAVRGTDQLRPGTQVVAKVVSAASGS